MGGDGRKSMKVVSVVVSRALPVAAALLALSAASSAPAQGRLQQPCDRACLSGITDQYLAAMLTHDPAKAPLAQNVKYTENAADVDVFLGDGIWATATKFGPNSYRAIDP